MVWSRILLICAIIVVSSVVVSTSSVVVDVPESINLLSVVYPEEHGFSVPFPLDRTLVATAMNGSVQFIVGVNDWSDGNVLVRSWYVVMVFSCEPDYQSNFQIFEKCGWLY